MKKLSDFTTREEVAGAVVDQVLAGKSGPLYVPPKMGDVLYARSLPIWVQEVLRRGLERSTRTDGEEYEDGLRGGGGEVSQ